MIYMKAAKAQAIMERTTASYDEAARAFSDSRNTFWSELEYLAEHAIPGDRVLDIGCGNGRLFSLLEPRSVVYTGFDSSEGLLAIARARHPNAAFVRGDATALPFPDASFDVVYSFATLHHIPSRELRAQAVKEAARALRPGGHYIVSVWDLWSARHFPRLLQDALGSIFGANDLDIGDCEMTLGHTHAPRFLHAFTERSLTRLLTSNGFEVLGTESAARPSGERNIVAVAKKK